MDAAEQQYVVICVGEQYLLSATQAVGILRRADPHRKIRVVHDDRTDYPPGGYERTSVSLSREMSSWRAYIEILTRLPEWTSGTVVCMDCDLLVTSPRFTEIWDWRPRQGFATTLYPYNRLQGPTAYRRKSQQPRRLNQLLEEWGLDVEPNWHGWNTGLLRFDKEARPLFDLWRQYARRLDEEEDWYPNDEISLAAAALKLRWHNLPTFPPRFSWIPGVHECRGGGRLSLGTDGITPKNRLLDAEGEEIFGVHLTAKGMGREAECWGNLREMYGNQWGIPYHDSELLPLK